MIAALADLYEEDYQTEDTRSRSAPTGNGGGLVRYVAICVVGTMGIMTPQAVESRSATSLVPVHYEDTGHVEEAGQRVELERTPAEDLMRIRAVLKPTVLELAGLFGVSRQAVYDWQGGAQPAPQTAARLSTLARAADVFEQAGLAVDARTLRRRVSGGGTVLDAVLGDGDAEEVARKLAPTLLREAEQRRRLAQRMAGRKGRALSVDDYGTPSLPEEL